MVDYLIIKQTLFAAGFEIGFTFLFEIISIMVCRIGIAVGAKQPDRTGSLHGCCG